jgi:RimJ/RimL family protein N-acetyltransferase
MEHEIFLVGPRVSLRPLQVEDAQGPYPTWLNDPDVCRFNSHHVMPYLRESAVSYIESCRKNTSDLVLAIVSNDDRRHVGNIALMGVRNNLHRCAEYSVVLGDKSVWGTGVAFEASYLIVKHGFDAFGLARVECGTSEDNAGMRKLAGRLGMKQEGVRRKAMWKSGRFVDIIEYGVLAEEFRSVEPPKGIG